jgi:hypothetical protein
VRSRKTWGALGRHQREAPGNLGYTVLRLKADHPEADSPESVARASERSGQPLTPVVFRKRLSRARRLFVELPTAEVQRGLDGATAEQVQEELADLGLLEYVRHSLASES